MPTSSRLRCCTEAAIDLIRVQIQSERLLLRPLLPQDAQPILQEFTAEITRYMFPEPPAGLDESMAFIQQSRADMIAGHDLVLAITRKENGEFLGCCGLHGKDDPTRPELGIWLKQRAHGEHYGREAIQALAKWAIDHITFACLIYPVDRNNIPSRKIPESLGGTVVRERTTTTANGKTLALLVYQISNEQLHITFAAA